MEQFVAIKGKPDRGFGKYLFPKQRARVIWMTYDESMRGLMECLDRARLMISYNRDGKTSVEAMTDVAVDVVSVLRERGAKQLMCDTHWDDLVNKTHAEAQAYGKKMRRKK